MLKNLLLSLILLGSGQSCDCQVPNSEEADVVSRLQKHHGIKLADNMTFVDTSGHVINFSSFYGKVCFVDYWYIGCPPCYNEIPFLKERYSLFAKDTGIIFIDICFSPPKQKTEWKKYLRVNAIPGVHLMISPLDFKKIGRKIIDKKLFAEAFPTYLILSKNGRIIGYDVPEPSSRLQLDYVLSKSIQGVEPAKALNELISEMKLFGEHKNSQAFIDWINKFYGLSVKQAIMKYGIKE